MHLILIRHGETAWSRAGRHTGTTDLDLLGEGRAQAEAIAPWVARALDGFGPAAIYASPLRRAAETARLAAPDRPATPSALLRECDYGAYEGLTRAEIRAIRPGWDFWRDGCEGGEDVAAVAARADLFLAEHVRGPEPVVAFSHGHMIRILAARALGLDPASGRLFQVDPASLSILRDAQDRPTITLWNLTPGFLP